MGAVDTHADDPDEPVDPQVWVIEVDRPTLVLGSAQGRDRATIDRRVDDHSLELDVVVRRSGGGAVFLSPGAQAWVDVIVPVGDPLWEADVGRAFGWLGSVWAEVVQSLVDSEVEVHEGALVRTRWSDVVCFAGLGPGEVTVGGIKAVGISQRRTRSHLRFQATALIGWQPERWIGALVDEPDRATALAAVRGAARPLGVEPEVLVRAFLGAIARR